MNANGSFNEPTSGGSSKYRVFTRVWWKYNPRWPDNREPHAGRRSYRGHPSGLTESEAREYCRHWNATHEPGPYSHKAEYERA